MSYAVQGGQLIILLLLCAQKQEALQALAAWESFREEPQLAGPEQLASWEGMGPRVGCLLLLRPAQVPGIDPHLALDQRAEGGLNAGPLLNLLSDPFQLLSSDITAKRFRIRVPRWLHRGVGAEAVPSPGGHARASDKPGAISTMGFLSPRTAQALSPVDIPSLSQMHSLWAVLSGMCQRRGGVRSSAGSINCRTQCKMKIGGSGSKGRKRCL